ncbi:LPXTG cell wall anchor domain-containing protein [Streptomyces mirabilis]|uniref:LPXTG cell wall anchor domain-containing protein n=1 Tax=Streptomyces mirabilis TaxID=68239 RepID=UPI002E1C11EF|nr:LPXTG cell wall anchor domain-containing protein [Streptomyces mirabilis]
MKFRPAVIAAAASVALFAGSPAARAAEDPGSLPACTDVSTAYGGYEQDEVTASVDVAATVLMAGGDWQPARGSVTNVGKRDLPAVVASAYPWLQTEDPDLADMSDFVKVEARTADGGWQPLDGSGRIDAPPLQPGETRTYELRVRVVKDVPKMPGGSEFAFTGTFADVYRFPDTGKEVACAGVAYGNDTFRIQRTATSPTPPTTPKPTTAKPTPSATKPTSTPSPTDVATAAPTTPPATTSAPPAAPSATHGEMAETGTSNATVPLAAAAGALAVLGVGAVLFARRRRG